MTGDGNSIVVIRSNWKKKGYGLVIHAGAGGRVKERSAADQAKVSAGLKVAYEAGENVLSQGGSAIDAACASVSSMEDNELFNAGRGAALTSRGRAELDASIMTGDGCAGAVAGSTIIKNPVYAARKVMTDTPHVLMINPSGNQAQVWGLQTVNPEYFITHERLAQLHNVQKNRIPFEGHGTVGAVAVDQQGSVCAATSTGGIVNQMDGRVGDTPIIGAGTFARDGLAGVSCTGAGEAFIRGAVAYDVIARMQYQGNRLDEAIFASIASNLSERGYDGAIIGVSAQGSVIVGRNSEMINAAYRDGDKIITLE